MKVRYGLQLVQIWNLFIVYKMLAHSEASLASPQVHLRTWLRGADDIPESKGCWPVQIKWINQFLITYIMSMVWFTMWVIMTALIFLELKSKLNGVFKNKRWLVCNLFLIACDHLPRDRLIKVRLSGFVHGNRVLTNLFTLIKMSIFREFCF